MHIVFQGAEPLTTRFSSPEGLLLTSGLLGVATEAKQTLASYLPRGHAHGGGRASPAPSAPPQSHETRFCSRSLLLGFLPRPCSSPRAPFQKLQICPHGRAELWRGLRIAGWSCPVPPAGSNRCESVTGDGCAFPPTNQRGGSGGGGGNPTLGVFPEGACEDGDERSPSTGSPRLLIQLLLLAFNSLKQQNAAARPPSPHPGAAGRASSNPGEGRGLCQPKGHRAETVSGLRGKRQRNPSLAEPGIAAVYPVTSPVPLPTSEGRKTSLRKPSGSQDGLSPHKLGVCAGQGALSPRVTATGVTVNQKTPRHPSAQMWGRERGPSPTATACPRRLAGTEGNRNPHAISTQVTGRRATGQTWRRGTHSCGVDTHYRLTQWRVPGRQCKVAASHTRRDSERLNSPGTRPAPRCQGSGG